MLEVFWCFYCLSAPQRRVLDYIKFFPPKLNKNKSLKSVVLGWAKHLRYGLHWIPSDARQPTDEDIADVWNGPEMNTGPSRMWITPWIYLYCGDENTPWRNINIQGQRDATFCATTHSLKTKHYVGLERIWSPACFWPLPRLNLVGFVILVRSLWDVS